MGADRRTIDPIHLLSQRSSGVLAHVTSLPGPDGSGDLGAASHLFLEFLERAGQRWWQMLPVGPTGYGDSPYSAQSSFAGNPAFVALEPMVQGGLLEGAAEDASPNEESGGAVVHFERVNVARDARLRAAFDAFERRPKKARRGFDEFRARSASWLEDFALFRALKVAAGEQAWTSWPKPLRRRERRALAKAHADLATEVRYHAFVQYQFAEQWAVLREHARTRNVGLIGDVPLYVAHDSADVWSQPRLFQLDDDGMPTRIAGVPPDYFSETGQRWGNPLYAWKEHEHDGFAWWTARLQSALDRFDAVRLDHFIGFRRYWEIDARADSAKDGVWRRGPGNRLFKALRQGLDLPPGSTLPFIAEDLGAVGPDVLAIRDKWKLPGTKVLQFAFGDDPSAASFRPHNYHRRAVVYTGTHDNDTTVGWYTGTGTGEPRTADAIAGEQRAAREYLGAPDGNAIHWRFLRAASASVAALAIFPLQDILGLDSRSRMNRPGTATGNWSWRAEGSALTADLAGELATMTAAYGRAPVASPVTTGRA